MTEAMIDLETLDTKPTGVIISIGLVIFEGDNILSEHYGVLSIQDQLELGRTINEDTLKWWMSRNDAARAVFKEKPASFKSVMSDMAAVIKKNKVGRVWSLGGDFDIPMVRHAFDILKIEQAWNFWDSRCFRTFCEDMGARYKSSRTEGDQIPHHALDDARAQTNHLIDTRRSRKTPPKPVVKKTVLENPVNLEDFSAEVVLDSMIRQEEILKSRWGTEGFEERKRTLEEYIEGKKSGAV